MSERIKNNFKNISSKSRRNISIAKPFHGYITQPLSRAGFLISKGLLGAPWPASEMEGGKNFPNYTGGQFARQGDEAAFYFDVESAVPPPDGLILSGGRTVNNRVAVNYTEQELERFTGIKGGWPKYSVSSGSTFYVTWSYQAAHKTRGYRWYITRQNWDPTERVTRESFELEPIYSDFNPLSPFWSYSAEDMAPWKDLSVELPSRTGHQILLCVWIIADSGMGFYQAFDLNFDDEGSGGNGNGGENGGGENGSGGENGGYNPEEDYPDWSADSVQYYVGDYVSHYNNVYVCTQAHVSNRAWAPGIAFTLWRQVS